MVTTADLALAADWLDCYDSAAEESASTRAVAAWLRAEVARRETEALARAIMRESGCSRARAMQAAGRVKRTT